MSSIFMRQLQQSCRELIATAVDYILYMLSVFVIAVS